MKKFLLFPLLVFMTALIVPACSDEDKEIFHAICVKDENRAVIDEAFSEVCQRSISTTRSIWVSSLLARSGRVLQ